MDKPLRILHLEDDPDFVRLVKEMLEGEGTHAEMILAANHADFTSALEKESFDVILADYMLPTCNGIQALQTARQKYPDTPFLIVSGTIGEQAAIESLKCGATDYVLKQKMDRLVPAIRRAVDEARERAQRKKAETELVRREKYFRTLTKYSLDVLSILNRDGIFLYSSPSLKTVLGYEPEELAGQNAFALVHPDDLRGAMQAFEQALQNPALRVTCEFRYRRRDGAWCHLEVVGQNRLDDPEIAGVVLNTRDITGRKKAAEALEKSETSLAAAQRIAHLGSWELDLVNLDDLNCNELRLSDETYRILGFEPRQVTVTRELYYKLVHPEDRQRLGETVSQALRNKEPYDLEYRIVSAGGEERVVRERSEIALDGSGKPIQMRGIIMDITARKELESELRQAQKIEAIGQLASGVAHDFNNILTVIQGHASMLLADIGLAGTGARSAQMIAQAADRAAGLTRQLLAFSRRQVMQTRLLDINVVVSDVAKMLGRLLGEDIVLQLNYSSHRPQVQGDAGMMEQVMMNLAVNARDAMPKGGQLTIKISTEDISAKKTVRSSEGHAGKFVCISVTDTGCGIAPENLRRIFEPFFTTKETGKGTGLGLATVYGIVKQHQGWIEVQSELGKGTTFFVYLPASAESAKPSQGKPVEKPMPGGTETILVVEDEAPVRELVCRVLAGLGYRILEAESGPNALDVWRQQKNEIDLLLTDLIMPDHPNGSELAEKLWKERPELKVIFTSGYGEDVGGKDFIARSGLNYLQKPYEPQKLASAVRTCLDSPKTQ